MNRDDLLFLTERVERQLANLLEDFPADRWLYQPFAGANHALWNVGHLGVVARNMAARLRGEPVPNDQWGELFGKGSTPQTDGAAGLPVAEVLEFSAKSRASFIEAIRTVPEARFADEVPENVRSIAPTFGRLVAVMAAHAALHVGQFAVLRKSLGLNPKMG